MATNEDVVKVLKKVPELKHVKVKALREAVAKLIEENTSSIYEKKKTVENIPIPDDDDFNNYVVIDEWDETTYHFKYEDRHYSVPGGRTKLVDGVRCFEKVTTVYVCPVCEKKFEVITVGGFVRKGGYCNKWYKGRHMDMCSECGRKTDNE